LTPPGRRFSLSAFATRPAFPEGALPVLPDPPCRGWSLVELIAVLALSGFVASLLLPAVLQARGQAERQQCRTNLKHLGLALHACQDSYNKLPPVFGPFGTAQGEGTLFFYLTPFLDETNVYHDAQGSVWKNGTFTKVIKGFLCPADAAAPEKHLYRDYLATSNYAANWLVFGNQGAKIPGSFPDGLSNTIVFAERYQTCDGQPNAWAYPGHYYWAPMFMYYSHGRFQVAPDGKSKECDVRRAQTPHAAGMPVALADGSVRELGEGLSARTFLLACNPDDGEKMPADWSR
jgi:type II secretory pathway pseudopilin PulG